MTYENDRNAAAREMVIDRAERCVEKLKAQPSHGVCAMHPDIAEGVAISLQMQIPMYRKCADDAGSDTLTFGKLKVTGAAAINAVMRFAVVAGVIYLILKMHGVAP